MAHVQHPTADRIVLEVDDNALEDWVAEGWTSVDSDASEQPDDPTTPETPLTLTQGAETPETQPAVSTDTPPAQTSESVEAPRTRRNTTPKEA